jgi:taurine transport system substrate-binding protein
MVDPGDFVTGMQQLAEFLVKHKQIDNAPPVKEWIMESMVP